MAGAGMVGMRMGDERARNGTQGIDKKIARGAIKPGGRQGEKIS